MKSHIHYSFHLGALLGGAAGNRLGAIRDAKGKPVGQVFIQLGGNQKAEVSGRLVEGSGSGMLHLMAYLVRYELTFHVSLSTLSFA